MLRAICRDASGWHVLRDVGVISELIAEGRTLVWAFADVEELADDLATISEEFSLDPLAVEDATNLKQRPKLEMYANHLFAVMHQIDEVDGQFEARQIACFVGRRWVLTLHDSSQRTIQEAVERLRRTEATGGASSIMHGLLDTIVDDYERMADDLEAATEQIEERVLAEPETDVQHDLYSLKQRLSRLRRYSFAGERVLGAFVTRDQPHERMTSLFRDVHDHGLRLLEQIDNIDAILNAVLELQRSAQANALNETTKRLTGWAAIIAVPTFIASVYGMNFELVPNEGALNSFAIVVGAMVAIGVGLYVYFRRRNWI